MTDQAQSNSIQPNPHESGFKAEIILLILIIIFGLLGIILCMNMPEMSQTSFIQ